MFSATKETAQNRDYLEEILGKTVPVVTRDILTYDSGEPNISRPGDFGKTKIVTIGGVKTLVTNSPEVANEVFKTKGKYFTQRLGNDEGTAFLPLFLIWR